MRYQSPVCECGGVLVFFEQIVFTKEYKIMKNGRVRKKSYSNIEEGKLNMGRLKCQDCGTEYYYDEDEHGRIKRDEVMNQY